MKPEKTLVSNTEHVSSPRDLSALEAVLRRVPDGSSITVSILPRVATDIIGQWNHGNRRLDQIAIARYSRDMREGRWQPDREIAIGLLDTGIRLGDGQHRLSAQEHSSTEQRYTVRVFTEESSFSSYVVTVDAGKPRTLANQFSIFGLVEGTGSAQRLERICNAMQWFLEQRPGARSTQERLDFAVGHKPALDFVLGLPSKTFKAHILAAIAFAHGRQKKAVEAFMNDMIGGDELRGVGLKLQRALPELNAASAQREKERAMALVMRVLADAVAGRGTTSIVKVQLDGGPVAQAVQSFCGKEAADKFIARHRPARVPT